VWEWCADHWRYDYNEAPRAWAGHVIRGGSCHAGAHHVRAAFRRPEFGDRDDYGPTDRTYDLGFRCAKVQ
jgi:formylglycine-generating enzyme required for sulfatase activity